MADSPSRALSTLFSTLIILDLIFRPATSSDYNDLVFKGCASQNFQEPSAASMQALNSLLNSMVSQSWTQTFYDTSVNEGAPISGLFQCRGDLTNSLCHECVSKAQNSVKKLCKLAVAARIQFNGCYLKYQVASFDDPSGLQLLYKVCAPNQMPVSDFDGLRATALGMILNGLSNGSLFYTGSYQSLFVLGQCEGDLSSGDCGNCIDSAVSSAKSECGPAASAQIYLNRCFVSYSFYSGKGPRISAPSSGSTDHTQRTVAIAVGGMAAIGFLFLLLLSLNAYLKRRHRKHEDW